MAYDGDRDTDGWPIDEWARKVEIEKSKSKGDSSKSELLTPLHFSPFLLDEAYDMRVASKLSFF